MKNKASSNRKNNKPLSVSTENMFTSDSDMESRVLQEGAGFLSFMFGSESSKYATKLILDGFEDGAQTVSLFAISHAINNSVKLNYGEQSKKYGRTIIHWLVITGSKIPYARSLLIEILKNTSGISKYINKQDNDGNTPAHHAMYLSELEDADDMDNIISALVKKGVDLSIRNKAGKNIVLEEEPVNNNQIFVKKSQHKELSDTEAAKIAKKIAEQFVIKTDEVSDTIHFNRNNTADQSDSEGIQHITEEAKKELQNKTSDKNLVKPINFGGAKNSSKNSEKSNSIDSANLVNELLTSFKKKSSVNRITNNFARGGSNPIFGTRRKISNFTSRGGDPLSSEASRVKSDKNQTDTDKFGDVRKKIGYNLNADSSSDISDISSSFGDEPVKFNNARENVSYSGESDTSDESDDFDDNTSKSSNGEFDGQEESDGSNNSESISSDGGALDNNDELLEQHGLNKLARFDDPESTKRHENAVIRIQEILGIDEILAKVYKSMLYKKIKEKNSGMRNDEISKELEKESSDENALKKFVKSLDIKKVNELKDIIASKLTEKKENNKKENNKKENNKKENNKKENNKKKDDKKENKNISRFIQNLSDDFDFNEESTSDIYTSD
jgi:hypothetical protein